MCPCTEQPSLCLALTPSRWAAVTRASHTRSLWSPNTCWRVLWQDPSKFQKDLGRTALFMPKAQSKDSNCTHEAADYPEHAERCAGLSFPRNSLQVNPYCTDRQIWLWPLPAPESFWTELGLQHRSAHHMKCPQVGKELPHHSPATDQHHSSHQLTG